MPHEAGPRSAADVALDMFKPFVESAIREHSGSVILWVPLLGDGLKYAIRLLGRKPVAGLAKASGGFFRPPRSWFPSGEMGNQMHRLAHEALGELGQAIAHTAEEISDEELETTIDRSIQKLLARFGGHVGDGAEAGGSQPMATDPEVVVWKQGAAGAETHEAHHPSCVALPPATVEETLPAQGGKPPKKIQKPNPALRKIPRSHAKAQGIGEHGACMAIFAPQAPSPATPTTGGKKKPLEIMGELTDPEHAELMSWMQALTAKKRKYVNHEFEARLTSVAELREILRHPAPLRLAAVGKLKDVVMEKFEKTRDELRAGVDATTLTMGVARAGMRSVRERLAETRHLLRGGKP